MRYPMTNLGQRTIPYDDVPRMETRLLVPVLVWQKRDARQA